MNHGNGKEDSAGICFFSLWFPQAPHSSFLHSLLSKGRLSPLFVCCFLRSAACLSLRFLLLLSLCVTSDAHYKIAVLLQYLMWPPSPVGDVVCASSVSLCPVCFCRISGACAHRFARAVGALLDFEVIWSLWCSVSLLILEVICGLICALHVFMYFGKREMGIQAVTVILLTRQSQRWWCLLSRSVVAFLSFTVSWGLLKLMSIESVMPSNLLILCHPLPLRPSVFPSIWVFSSESALHIR